MQFEHMKKVTTPISFEQVLKMRPKNEAFIEFYYIFRFRRTN
jgi:hypothetical protein